MPLKKGDVIQLNPKTVHNETFAGCFMVVEQPKTWGCVGVIILPKGRLAPYRSAWVEMEFIGRSPFPVPDPFTERE